MNIRQYYRLAANISLNGSLLALVLAALLVFPTIILLPKKEIVFFFIPFLFYSFLSYHKYLIHTHRSEESKVNNFDEQGECRLLAGKEMLLEFLPAPSLRMLIFNPDGLLIGELRDLECRKYRWLLPYFIDILLPQAYGLFDERNQLISVFRLKSTGMVELSGRITGHGVLGSGQRSNCKNKWTLSANGRTFTIHSESLFTDICVTDEGNTLLARMRKGWMPLEWEKYFKDANTPVLTFNDHTKTEEKLTVFAILTVLLRYQNH